MPSHKAAGEGPGPPRVPDVQRRVSLIDFLAPIALLAALATVNGCAGWMDPADAHEQRKRQDVAEMVKQATDRL
jgi:hypothetical protein